MWPINTKDEFRRLVIFVSAPVTCLSSVCWIKVGVKILWQLQGRACLYHTGGAHEHTPSPPVGSVYSCRSYEASVCLSPFPSWWPWSEVGSCLACPLSSVLPGSDHSLVRGGCGVGGVRVPIPAPSLPKETGKGWRCQEARQQCASKVKTGVPWVRNHASHNGAVYPHMCVAQMP